MSSTQERTIFNADPASLPGATRIGVTWLHVPPINIHFNNPKFEDVVMSMRQPSANHLKTGRSLLSFDMDIVFTGTRMINDKLAHIIAQIRRTPFLTIYNQTIRKTISYNQDTDPDNVPDEIPVAITGYTVHTEMDLPDTLIMRLSFLIFNFTPYVPNLRYLKQTIGPDGAPVYDTPAINIEDSNLFRQFYEDILIEHDDIEDFMFAGDIPINGRFIPDTNDTFESRININRTDVIKNGSRIRKIPGNHYLGTPQTLSIGYHVHTIDDALDLRLGAYKSRTINGTNGAAQWVENESDLRKDIILNLQGVLSPKEEANFSTKELVEVYGDILISNGIAIRNTAGKFIKKFTITSDTRKNIQGITLRRSIPITTIPIISSAVPTCQYLGGADSTTTITIQTDDENFIESLMAVDSSIEQSQRNVARHSGTELTYIDNELANLNGSYVVITGAIDAQSIPDNPGSYILSWAFSEQAETLEALISPAEDIFGFKKLFVRGILETQRFREWTFDKSYSSNEKFVFKHGDPSYIETILIPSIIRAVRNGFIKYFKDVLHPLYRDQPNIIGEKLYGTPGQAFNAFNFAVTDPGFAVPAPQIDATSQAAIFNKLWRIITAQEVPPAPTPSTQSIDRIYGDFSNWLRSRSDKSATDTAKTLVGSVNTIVDGDIPCLELLLRSPKMLKLELDLMDGTAKSPATVAKVFTRGRSLVDYIKNNIKEDGTSLTISQAIGTIANDVHFAISKIEDPNELLIEKLFACDGLGEIGALATLDDRDAIFTTLTQVANTNGSTQLQENARAAIKKIKSEVGSINMIPDQKTATLDPSLIKFSRAAAKTTLEDIYDSIQRLNCYRDLGLPFTYLALNPVTNTPFPPKIYTEPDFYMFSGPVIPTESTLNKSLGDIQSRIKTQEQKAKSSPSLTTGLGTTMSSSINPNGVADSYLTSYKERIHAGDASSAKTGIGPSSTITGDVNRYVKDLKDRLAGNGTIDPSNVFQKVRSFSNSDDIYFTDNIKEAMAIHSRETDHATIAEAQLQHKAIKSTFADFNPDIDSSMSNIVYDARTTLLANPKFHSLARAFPTFRLSFRLQNTPYWLMFEEFFDYRAVEQIRYYKDKASASATVHIVLNNHNNILTDLKALMAKVSHTSHTLNTNERFTDQYRHHALQSLFVRPGTDIQVRMGYVGNPGELPIVFNGRITEIEPGEKFEIVCSGYGMDLMTDSEISSFTGWACSAKQLIWWMLVSSSVTHLGTTLWPSLLPSKITDFIGGTFSVAENIYYNGREGPDSEHWLQSYNTDDMTKWDVLQDIAAVTPGYICQTANFDNRETVFFGRPDQLYKYTNDWGTTSSYPNIEPEAITALAVRHPDKDLVAKVKKSIENKDKNFKALNYMQWLPYNEAIKSAYDAWASRWKDNKISDLLIEYCQYVELLGDLSSLSGVGNTQYSLFTDTNSKGGVPNQTPVLNDTETTGATARTPVPTIEATPSPVNKTTWQSKDADVQTQVGKHLVESLIPLDLFLTGDLSKSATTIVHLFDGLLTQNDDIPKAEKIVEVQRAISLYDQTKDTKALAVLFRHDPDLLTLATKQFDDKLGINNPIIIYCWTKIAHILSDVITEVKHQELLTGVVKDTSAAAGAEQGRQLAGVTLSTLPSIELRGVFDVAIRIQSQLAPPSALTNNITILKGPITSTSLNAHRAFRNLLLNQFVNINSTFQELTNLFAISPVHKRFRQYHIKTSYRDIVSNTITANLTNMWNRVKVKYKRHDFAGMGYIPRILNLFELGGLLNDDFTVEAGQTLDERVVREIVMPIENARTVWQARAYATSLLAEGVRHMYSGALTLTGDETIKPYDVIILHDDYNRMYGPIEVKSVEHIMTAESGFITIVEPHAYVEPLGVSFTLATILEQVVDLGLDVWLGLSVIEAFIAPPLGLPQIAGAIAAKNAVKTGAKAAASAAKKAARGEIRNLLKAIAEKGKGITTGIKDFAIKQGGLWEEAHNKTLDNMLVGTITEVADRNGLSISVKDVIRAANELRPATKTAIPLYDSLGQIPSSTLRKALKSVGFKADSITEILSTSEFAAFNGASLPGLGSLNLGFGTAKRYLADNLGMTTIGIVKFLAVATPLYLCHMFAGMTDNNYACPLHIIPLSLDNEPYYAGLDGLTHESGILNYVGGEFRKFWGSVNTISSVVEETISFLASESFERTQ